jgi:hypothetical protein
MEQQPVLVLCCHCQVVAEVVAMPWLALLAVVAAVAAHKMVVAAAAALEVAAAAVGLRPRYLPATQAVLAALAGAVAALAWLVAVVVAVVAMAAQVAMVWAAAVVAMARCPVALLALAAVEAAALLAKTHLQIQAVAAVVGIPPEETALQGKSLFGGGSEKWQSFLAQSSKQLRRLNTSSTLVFLTRRIGTFWLESGRSLSQRGTSENWTNWKSQTATPGLFGLELLRMNSASGTTQLGQACRKKSSCKRSLLPRHDQDHPTTGQVRHKQRRTTPRAAGKHVV